MVAKPKQNSFRTGYSLIVDESDLRESPLQIFRQCLWIAGVDKKDLFLLGTRIKTGTMCHIFVLFMFLIDLGSRGLFL